MKLLVKKLQALKRYPLVRYAGTYWCATPGTLSSDMGGTL